MQEVRDARTMRTTLLNSNVRLTLDVFRQLKEEQGRAPHINDLVIRMSSIKSGRMPAPKNQHNTRKG